MRILVTNDDGIHSPGLTVAENIARSLSDDVWVVAPENEQSGASHSLTLTSPLRLASIRMTPPEADAPYGGTALVPLGAGPIALVLVRVAGPAFHQSELWRVGQVGQIVGTVLAPV